MIDKNQEYTNYQTEINLKDFCIPTTHEIAKLLEPTFFAKKIIELDFQITKKRLEIEFSNCSDEKKHKELNQILQIMSIGYITI